MAKLESVEVSAEIAAAGKRWDMALGMASRAATEDLASMEKQIGQLSDQLAALEDKARIARPLRSPGAFRALMDSGGLGISPAKRGN